MENNFCCNELYLHQDQSIVSSSDRIIYWPRLLFKDGRASFWVKMEEFWKKRTTPLQLSYRVNTSMQWCNLHFIPLKLHSPNILPVLRLSSAASTVHLEILQADFSQLIVSDLICRWISDSLTDRKQHASLREAEQTQYSTESPCWDTTGLFSLLRLYHQLTLEHTNTVLIRLRQETKQQVFSISSTVCSSAGSQGPCGVF